MMSKSITGSDGLGDLILKPGKVREVEILWATMLTFVVATLIIF